MNADDEKRLKAASSLRESARVGGARTLKRELAKALGIRLDACTSEGSHTKILRGLADLIDRPTCRICATDHEYEDSVRCDRCRMTFRRPWEPFKYCPNCGAEVVMTSD